MLSFFPRGVLDEILNLIESVLRVLPSYSCSKDFLLTLNLSARFRLSGVYACPRILPIWSDLGIYTTECKT